MPIIVKLVIPVALSLTVLVKSAHLTAIHVMLMIPLNAKIAQTAITLNLITLVPYVSLLDVLFVLPL